MTWPFACSHFPFAAKIALNFSQTKWLVRPAEHGGPHTIAELPPRERQCDGRCRHHSFILGSSCQYRKEHLHSWINRSGEATNFQPVSSTYIFKFIASEFTLCLLPYFIFLQHISNKSSSALAKRSQSMMKSPPSNQLVSPTMKTAIAAKKASPPSYKRVAHQDIVIARLLSRRKGTQSDNEVTMKTPAMIRSVESCPNFPSLLAWPLQQQDINSIGSIHSADQATSARTVLDPPPVAPRAPSITDALEEEDDGSPRFKLRPRFLIRHRLLHRPQRPPVQRRSVDAARPAVGPEPRRLRRTESAPSIHTLEDEDSSRFKLRPRFSMPSQMLASNASRPNHAA